MDEDLVRYIRGRLRALLVEQAEVEERIIAGTCPTLESYREAVGMRRGLEMARSLLLEPFDKERKDEIASR